MNYLRPQLEPLEDRQMLSAVTWTIDSSQSFATVALPDQDFTLPDPPITGTVMIRNTTGQDGGPWDDGNSAPIAGTIETEYTDGSSIQFLTGLSNIVGVNSGNYIPDPANWDSINQVFTSGDPGPGVYGGRIRGEVVIIIPLSADVGWFNFTDLSYSVGSGPLAISSGMFPANTTDVGIASVTINAYGVEDVLGFGQVLPDTQEVLTDVVETNSGATATITTTGALTRRLTFPINIPVSVEIPGDTPEDPPLATITGTISGQIVADATLPEEPEPATVTGRRLFYNNSIWDNPGYGFTNATAIAPDKVAYIPTGANTSSFANMSSYTKGINGIMVEVAGAHNPLTASDFTIRMSGQEFAANNSPSTWAAAPSFAVTQVADTPTSGTDRYELTWADGAITNRYVYVLVEGNDAAGGFNTNTGLETSDYFFFGSMIGDAGSPEFYPNVDNTDQVQVRNNGGQPALQNNAYDFNRDAIVDPTDEIIARNNQTAMPWLDLGVGPFGPEAPAAEGDDGSGSAVASALAATSDSGSGGGGASLAERLEVAAEPVAAAAPSAAQAPMEGGAASSGGAEGLDVDVLDLALDDDLLDALLE